ncbi:hypothetical protein H6F90_00110 [Trichocoleus sp. FACHB-591]|uniref:hypothetical protein n=1 Tax=Trichocoleus sp. FACHB-591 TaxID=2692872 RepID=UPI001683DCCF|nr:hypothetical protein [Trichocoleus sp. FACHB-591]MBD2093557.1 hypothetical protein [Trichocoleus sp. FACHB-591]
MVANKEYAVEALAKENEELRQKLEASEEANEELRRQDAIDEMVAKAEARLLSRIKQVGAVGTAILALAGFATFIAFVDSVSKTVNEQASTAIAEKVVEKASKDIRESVSKSLISEFRKDQEFRSLVNKVLVDTLAKDQTLRNSVTTDPTLQDKITSVVEETVRKQFVTTSKEASSTGDFAQAVQTVYAQETYFVVSGSDTARATLEKAVLGKALSNGFNAKICSPKGNNKRYALVVSDRPVLALSYEDALKVREKARKTVQGDAYILSRKGNFFDCTKDQMLAAHN